MDGGDNYITISAREWITLKSMVIEIRDAVMQLSAASATELLTPAEVCKMLRIGRTTYQRHVNDGVIEQVRIGEKKNSRVFVKRSEINRLIDEGKL